jgi:hypothetical protein
MPIRMQLGKSPLVRRSVLRLKTRLNDYPAIKTWLSRARFRLWKTMVRRRGTSVHPAFALERTSWANPAELQLMIPDVPYGGITSRKYANRGKVVDGDWDRTVDRFEQTDLYQGFEDHFVRGIAWDQTRLFRRVKDELLERPRYGCRSVAEYVKKLQGMDVLYERIARIGYRPQSEIAHEQGNLYKAEDEISICIGRDGDLIFEDGRHRLAIAKLLGLARVPVKITMVHKLWQDFRNEILDYATTHGGTVYQRITHPDLALVPHTYSDRRFDILREVLPLRSGSMLDIGSHWGYFCHRFEEVGFECQAIESSAKNAYFLRKLHRASNRRFAIRNCSIFDHKGPMRFDIVLALNIFHYFLKDKATFEKLKEFLRGLDTTCMLFEPHRIGEPVMIGAYRNLDNEASVRFVLDNSCLKSARQLGEAEDGRGLYLLTR